MHSNAALQNVAAAKQSTLQNKLLVRHIDRRLFNGGAWHLAARLIGQSGCNESLKEGMRLVGFALKFGVILATNKVGVIA
jgi:hypothetical protein